MEPLISLVQAIQPTTLRSLSHLSLLQLLPFKPVQRFTQLSSLRLETQNNTLVLLMNLLRLHHLAVNFLSLQLFDLPSQVLNDAFPFAHQFLVTLKKLIL